MAYNTLVVDTETVEVTLASGLVGLIASQDPSPGTEVVFGDEIRVRLGVIKQVTVPMDSLHCQPAPAALTNSTPLGSTSTISPSTGR